MSKLETVRRLPPASSPSEAVRTMKQLQESLQRLPTQAEELAAAIEPLAKALEKIVPTLESMDRRLQAIESALPRHEDGRPAKLAAQGTLQAGIKSILERLSGPFVGLLGRK